MEDNKFVITFENIKTKEIVEVEPDDDKKFDEMMLNNDFRLIF